ncbi:MAG: RNA polymerase sigma factor [Verrucomicrobiota bacterium]
MRLPGGAHGGLPQKLFCRCRCEEWHPAPITSKLFYGEGMKANQIAEALDVSVSSVKVWLHRARKRLAAHLKPT